MKKSIRDLPVMSHVSYQEKNQNCNYSSSRDHRTDACHVIPISVYESFLHFFESEFFTIFIMQHNNASMYLHYISNDYLLDGLTHTSNTTIPTIH
jgi:hypothetical protein